MDDALVQRALKYGSLTAAAVLILVVMDDALVHSNPWSERDDKKVS